MIERLAWDEVWLTGSGEHRRLADMDSDHLLSVLGYLMRHGHELWAQGHELSRTTPTDRAVVNWLAARPIWTACVRVLRSRHALGDRENVFSILRVRAAEYRQAAVGQYTADLEEQERLFMAR